VTTQLQLINIIIIIILRHISSVYLVNVEVLRFLVLLSNMQRNNASCIYLIKGEISYLLYRVIRNDCRGFNNLPPRSPDATPCDFFLWAYVKDQVYVPPLPTIILEMKVRIRTAIETITADILQTVWNELDYRVGVCRITKGAHIEHL